MMSKLSIQIIALLLLIMSGGIATAASLLLTMTPSTVNFPNADPDFSPQVPANSTVFVTIGVNGNPSAAWSLTTQARGNLFSGAGSIPISTVSWKGAKNSGDADIAFYDGIMNITPTTVASGVGKDDATGTLNFSIQNLWTYATGAYSQIADFTLSSP